MVPQQIDSCGRIVKQLETGTNGHLIASPTRDSRISWAVRLGDMPPLYLVCVALAICVRKRIPHTAQTPDGPDSESAESCELTAEARYPLPRAYIRHFTSLRLRIPPASTMCRPICRTLIHPVVVLPHHKSACDGNTPQGNRARGKLCRVCRRSYPNDHAAVPSCHFPCLFLPGHWATPPA